MPPRFCCCGIPGCIVHTDAFTRDTTEAINPPNGSWNVIEPAEWEIEDGRLRHIIPGPIITTKQQTEPPRNNGAGYTVKIYAKLMDIKVGNETFAIICAYVDALNYRYVKFTWNGVSGMWPEFRMVVAGVDSLVMDRYTHPGGVPLPIREEPDDLDPDLATIRVCDIKVCFGPADWTADTGTSFESGYGIAVFGTDHPWTTITTEQERLSPGLGMGGFLYGYFDLFAYHIHWESDVICDHCSCLCIHPDPDLIDEYSAVPEEVTVTFVPANFTASEYPCSINNKSIVLKQVATEGDTDLSPVKLVWSNRVGMGTPSDVAATLTCSPVAGSDRFRLSLFMPSSVGSFTFGTSGSSIPDWDISTCLPLNLVMEDELSGPVTTCELDPGPPPVQGIRNALCIGGTGCIAENPTNTAFLAGLRWRVVVTD